MLITHWHKTAPRTFEQAMPCHLVTFNHCSGIFEYFGYTAHLSLTGSGKGFEIGMAIHSTSQI